MSLTPNEIFKEMNLRHCKIIRLEDDRDKLLVALEGLIWQHDNLNGHLGILALDDARAVIVDVKKKKDSPE